MKRSTLGAVALGLAGAAVGGYGAAMGRDAWHATKKSSSVLFLLAILARAVSLPFLGARDICRGYPKDERAPWARGLLSVASGFGAGWLLAGYPTGWAMTAAQWQLVVWVTMVSAAAGALIGFAQKPARQRRFAIAERNEDFLASHGFVETGETEVSHIDGNGDPLRLLERTTDTIVFMAVGRRNKRAYIKLSTIGEMVGYTGVIDLNQPRIYY